jgi:hypothetical protein
MVRHPLPQPQAHVCDTPLTKGVHLKIVSEMLGHSSIAITLDTYIHVIPGLGKVAASAMEDVLSDDEDDSIDQLDDEERP